MVHGMIEKGAAGQGTVGISSFFVWYLISQISTSFVIPADAGIRQGKTMAWTPFFNGMTYAPNMNGTYVTFSGASMPRRLRPFSRTCATAFVERQPLRFPFGTDDPVLVIKRVPDLGKFKKIRQR